MYGNGPKKSPLLHILESMKEFVDSAVPDSVDVMSPMQTSPGSSCDLVASCSSVLDIAEVVEVPAPRNATRNEKSLVGECLRRWKKEIEDDIQGKEN